MRNRISRILFIQLISIILIIIGTCNVYADSPSSVATGFSPPAEVHGGFQDGGQFFCAQKGAELGGATTYNVYGAYALPAGLAYAYNHGIGAGAMQELVWANQSSLNNAHWASYIDKLEIKQNQFKELFAYEYANVENSFASSNKAVLLGVSEEAEELLETQINVDMTTFKSVKQYMAAQSIVSIVGKKGTNDCDELIGIIKEWEKNMDYSNDYYNEYMDKLDELENIHYKFDDVVNSGAVRDDEVGIISREEWRTLENQVNSILNSNIRNDSSINQLNNIQNNLGNLSDTAQDFMDVLYESFETIENKIMEELEITEEDREIMDIADSFSGFCENNGYSTSDTSMYFEVEAEPKEEEDINNVVKVERDGENYIIGPYSLSYTDGGIGSDFSDIVSITATQYTKKGGEVIRRCI